MAFKKHGKITGDFGNNLVFLRDNIYYHKGFKKYYKSLGMDFYAIEHTKRLKKELEKSKRIQKTIDEQRLKNILEKRKAKRYTDIAPSIVENAKRGLL